MSSRIAVMSPALAASVTACAIAALMVGCAPVSPKPVPDSVGVYNAPPVDRSATAFIDNSLSGTKILGSQTRSRVESVDLKAIPASPGAQQPSIEIVAGKHVIVAACDSQFGSVHPKAALDIEMIAGHRYVLKCENVSSLLNVGTDIYIEDASDNNLVVSKQRACAPVSPKPVPDSVGFYNAPLVDRSAIASIDNSLSGTKILGSQTRSRVESVDLKAIPASPGAQQPSIEIVAGKHVIVAACNSQCRSQNTVESL